MNVGTTTSTSTSYQVPTKKELVDEVVYLSCKISRMKWWEDKSGYKFSLKRAISDLNEHYPQ